MSSDLHVVRAGVGGVTLLLVHGSASDHTTWSLQLAGGLRERFTLVAYDRRPGAVEAQAGDAATLLTDRTIVVGLSFGAVVALELIRRRPPGVIGAVLIEPPMGASDDAPAAPAEFIAEFDRLAATEGGPAAGMFFLRAALGEAELARIPRAFQDRSAAKWREIRADSTALIEYRPRYAELRGAVTVPVQLIGGERSAPYFRPTLNALYAALPDARLEIIRGAGHMLHVDAHKRFASVLEAFAADLGLR